MRSHDDIMTEAMKGRTAADLAAMIGPGVTKQNVIDWRRRNLIPADRWLRLVDLGFASYRELAAHAVAHAASKPAKQTKRAA